MENILALPVISGANPARIHDFYESLVYNVQSLETMGKTSECKALVRGILPKLRGIKAELVQGDESLQTWDFTQLINSLHAWREIHPREARWNQTSFQIKERDRQCGFCEDTKHKASDYNVVSSTTDRKRILQEKRLCFNCTGPHRVTCCRSRGKCAHCKQRHHTSICDRQSQTGNRNNGTAMTALHGEEEVCHPVVIVKVVHCWILAPLALTFHPSW